MDAPTRAKLALALIAGIIFAGSMWTGQDWLRWVAIGLLAAAVLLRFIYPGSGRRRRNDED
jgi:Flp pilus assembly protein TadB